MVGGEKEWRKGGRKKVRMTIVSFHSIKHKIAPKCFRGGKRKGGGKGEGEKGEGEMDCLPKASSFIKPYLRMAGRRSSS